MSGATAEALAWKKRADAEELRGVRVGNREICRSCLRPLQRKWGSIPRCRCGTVPNLSALALHGLTGIPNAPMKGTMNRD